MSGDFCEAQCGSALGSIFLSFLKGKTSTARRAERDHKYSLGALYFRSGAAVGRRHKCKFWAEKAIKLTVLAEKPNSKFEILDERTHHLQASTSLPSSTRASSCASHSSTVTVPSPPTLYRLRQFSRVAWLSLRRPSETL